MYVGKKYTATQTKAFAMHFQCSGCQFESEAVVIGVGQGQGNSPFMLDNDGAAERAEISAAEASRKNAEMIVTLAPCKRCGHRPGARSFWMMTVLHVVLFSVAGLGLGALLAALFGRNGTIGYVIGLGSFGLGAAFHLYLRWISFSTASNRVAFIDGDGDDDDAVAKPKKKKKRKKKKVETSDAPAAGEASAAADTSE